MIRPAILVVSLALTALPGCRGIRHVGESDTAEVPHLESAALVCRTPETATTIALSRGEAGFTCEQAWEDLSRVTDELLLFTCEPECGNGQIRVDDRDYSPVFDGEPLPWSSYLSFGLTTEGGEHVQAYLAVVADAPETAQDSYLRAVDLTQQLRGIDRIASPETVPSAEASPHPRTTIQARRALAPSE